MENEDIFLKDLINFSPSNLIVEWGGSLRCMTSDGRTVNIADELNKIESEKNKEKQ